MAFSHGSNDGQKFIDLYAKSGFSRFATGFQVQPWVILICSVVMGRDFGGGWRIIEKVGTKWLNWNPDQG